MPANRWSAYDAITTVLSTELNALANNGVAVSAAQDNGTNLRLFADYELALTYAVAPTAGAAVELYLVPSVDGTNYPDTTDPIAGTALVGVFPLRAVTTAQRIALRGVLLTPGLYKLALKNAAGQAMGASGHTLKQRTYGTQSV